MALALCGLGVSSGVAVGRLHLLHPPWLPVVPEPVPRERVEREIERFHAARTVARAELQRLRVDMRAAIGERYAGILEAQLLMLDDPRLIDETVQRVRAGSVTARWALHEVVARLSRRFDGLSDPYIRERGGELADVHRRLQRALAGSDGEVGAADGGPRIAIAPSLGPSDAAALTRAGVVGLATDAGGPTSHTAILAQALAVPAVVGLRDASRRVRAGAEAILDGDAGTLVVDPTAADVERARERVHALAAAEDRRPERRAVTEDGIAVTLRANIEFAAELETALRLGAEGVGLYRSEFLFLAHAPAWPDEQQHYRTYREIAERVAPQPAVLRTLDLGGEKYFHELLRARGRQAGLGLRGVRLCLARPEIFRPQLRGLLRAATASNVRVLLPLVVTPEEVRDVRALLAQEAAALQAEGQPARADVPVGVMIEVPAAAAAADVLAREADFLSVGTNDLFQYALAVDRSDESVAHLYQPGHPGLLRLLRFVVESGERRGIAVALCGELAADPSCTGLLIGLGFRELSVHPQSLGRIRDAVRATVAAPAEQELIERLRPHRDRAEEGS